MTAIGRHPRNRYFDRSAFTLLEVMLALCLVVASAVMAWPTIRQTMNNQRLRKAADQLCAAWMVARLDAMESGEAMVFRYMPDADRYRVERQSGLIGGNPTSDEGTAGDGDAGQSTVGRTRERTLPEGITFVATQADPQPSEGETAFAAELSLAAEAGWSESFIFYPDGTCSSLRVVMKNEEDRTLEVAMRGLTGVSTIGEIQSSGERRP